MEKWVLDMSCCPLWKQARDFSKPSFKSKLVMLEKRFQSNLTLFEFNGCDNTAPLKHPWLRAQTSPNKPLQSFNQTPALLKRMLTFDDSSDTDVGSLCHFIWKFKEKRKERKNTTIWTYCFEVVRQSVQAVLFTNAPLNPSQNFERDQRLHVPIVK